MGIFSKDKNQGFIVQSDETGPSIKGEANLSPDAITADEISSLWVLGNEDDTNSNSVTSPLEKLKNRMNITRGAVEKSDEALETKPLKVDTSNKEEAKPSPKETPLTAGMLNSPFAKSPSTVSNHGSPTPAGTPVITVSRTPPTLSPSVAACSMAACIRAAADSDRTGKLC